MVKRRTLIQNGAGSFLTCSVQAQSASWMIGAAATAVATQSSAQTSKSAAAQAGISSLPSESAINTAVVASGSSSNASAVTTAASTVRTSTMPVAAAAIAVYPPPLLSGVAHPKFVNYLPNPLLAINVFQPDSPGGAAYTLRFREFKTSVGLVDGAGVPLSTVVWGYGATNQVATSPGRTFYVRAGSTLSVSYVNELYTSQQTSRALGVVPLKHRLPLDTTLAWANPGNLGGLAPVPLVTHRHGGLAPSSWRSASLSDGLPDAWATVDANRDGSPDHKGRLWSRFYTYAHPQEAGHLWYHDHALGITRQNVVMGLAGHYIVRDANEDALVNAQQIPAPSYEVPIVIQDRMFTAAGDLFYPSSDPLNPNAPAVTHLPEFFGDFILVNGVVWPKHPVEPRSYRLRLLNGCDSRFLQLKFQVQSTGALLNFYQIGTELGLMDAPVPLNQLLLAPGERADIVISFQNLKNKLINILNTAQAPFPVGLTPDPASVGKILQFQVTQALNKAIPDVTVPTFLRPVWGRLPTVKTTGLPVRKLMLAEGTDSYGRLQPMLGTVNPAPGNPTSPQHGTFFYSDPVTEVIKVGTTEIWEIHNVTVDAHPIHLHMVDFRVLNREAILSHVLVPKPMGIGGANTGAWLTKVVMTGAARAAELNEQGRKDTVVSYPNEVTRIVVQFNSVGETVWHCHILSHEDHDMMRRIQVV